jgi:hypothetical protein
MLKDCGRVPDSLSAGGWDFRVDLLKDRTNRQGKRAPKMILRML